MSKSPYSLDALIEAFETLYGADLVYDEYKAIVSPRAVADDTWDSLEDWSRKEIEEYLG